MKAVIQCISISVKGSKITVSRREQGSYVSPTDSYLDGTGIKPLFIVPIGDALRSQFSWTHYRLLMRIDDSDKRLFYEIECAANN